MDITQAHYVYLVRHQRCAMDGGASSRLGSRRQSMASLLHVLLHRSRHQHQPAGRDALVGPVVETVRRR